MKFNPGIFPNYKLLSQIERFFLRTCCYYPPRSRRVISPYDINESGKYKSIYESAFGSEIWSLIENKSVVDLGCGQGGFALVLGIQGASLALGVDIQNLFSHAIQKAQKENIGNKSFFQGELAAMADNSVDIVMSHDSFEHFHDPQAVLEEMVRVLRPGGSVLIKFGPPWRNPWGATCQVRLEKIGLGCTWSFQKERLCTATRFITIFKKYMRNMNCSRVV